MSKTSVSWIVFLKTRLKSVDNLVFTQKLLCLVINNPFHNSWSDEEYWNGVVVLRVSFGAFLKKQFDFCNFTNSSEWVEFDRRLQSWEIGLAKISVPSFRNLSDKLSMPAALDGFKPFKTLSGDEYFKMFFKIYCQEMFQKFKI